MREGGRRWTLDGGYNLQLFSRPTVGGMKLRKRYSMSMGPKKNTTQKKRATTPCYRRTHVNKLQTGPPRVKALVGETLADLTAPL